MFMVVKCNEFNGELIDKLLKAKIIKGCDIFVTEKDKKAKYKLYYHMADKPQDKERIEPFKKFFKEHIIPMEENRFNLENQHCIRKYYLDKDTGKVKYDY